VNVDPIVIQRNETQRLRLVALVQRLTDEDLSRTLDGGWTVSAALAHLAFWDTFDVALLTRWRYGQPPPIEPDWYADALNEAALHAWLLVPPRDASTLAVEAAEAIDEAVAALGDQIVEALLARNEAWMILRYVHRREHVDQIEDAVGLPK
jgi:hypothetical protein